MTDVLEEITREDPMPATSGTVRKSQKTSHDNTEQLNTDIPKKKKATNTRGEFGNVG